MRNKLWKKLLAGLLAVTIAGTPVISSAMAEERITSGATEEADQTRQEEEQITGTESEDTTERVETESTETVEAGTEDTETKDTETENSETDENYELTWNNPDMDNMAGLLSVSVTSEKPFETGDSLDVQEMEQSEDYDALLESLQQELAGEELEIGDAYLTEELTITDASGNVAEDYQNLLVKTYLEDASVLQEGRLYHYTSDEVWEQIDYEVSGDTEEETDCVQFMTQELGRFCFVAVAEQTYEEDTEDKIDTFSEDEVDTTTPTAILYSASGDIDKNKDGELVFQIGNAVDPDKGTVVATYTGFTENTTKYVPWNSYMKRRIKKVVFKDKISPKCTKAWFSGYDGSSYDKNVLEKIDGFEKLDTSNVVDMSAMFECCRGVDIDFSNFDTANVTDMSNMFYGSGFSQLNLSSFNTSNVTNMWKMFSYSRTLKSIDVTSFDTSNVTSMFGMFEECRSLEKLDISNFETGNCTSMSYMFEQCEELEALDVSKFNTENVTGMNSMFWDCKKLKTLDVSNFNTENVRGMDSMFGVCEELETLDVSNFNTEKVTDMDSMFYGCKKLKTLDVSNFNTENVTGMERMFYGCKKVEILDVSNFNTENVTGMGDMFYGCEKLKTLDVSNFNTKKVVDMGYMFKDCKKIKILNVSNSDVGNVTSMWSMFEGCSSLEELDLSSFNTENVTNMQAMFEGCSSLKELDLSSFNTKKVNNMYYMFAGCTNLTTLDLSSFDTGKVTNMKYMFSGCSIGWLRLNQLTKLQSDCELISTDWKCIETGDVYDTIELEQKSGSLEQQISTFARNAAITFDTCGGTPKKITEEAWVGITTLKELQISEPAKIGYIFEGWYTDPQEGTQLEADSIIEHLNYYAHWIPCQYQLVLNPNGAEADAVTISMKYGELYHLNADTFTRDGYVISGWNTRRNGKGTAYEADGTIGNLTTTDADEVILYAQWASASKYVTVSFDSNGGEPVADRTLEQDSKLGTLPDLAREGYTFLGWYQDVTSDKKADADTVVSTDIILTAKWVKDPVVIFNGNNVVDDTQRTVKYNAKLGTLPSYRVNDTRYQTFLGWYTEAAGGTQIDASQIVTEDVTYYAHWGWKPSFKTNGGKFIGTEEYQWQEDPEYTIMKLPEVLRDGYKLEGWYLSDGTKVEDGATVNLSKGGIITASWNVADIVNVTLDSNSGKYYGDKNLRLEKGAALTGIYSPDRDGFLFAGWMAEEDGKYYKNGDPVMQDITLVAQWKELQCAVTFDPEDGEIYSGSKTKKIPTGSTINTIPGARKANYILDGWYTEKDGKGNKLDKNTVIQNDVTYYAYYIPVFSSNEIGNYTYTFGAEWINASDASVDNREDNLEFHLGALSSSAKTTASLHIRFELNKKSDDDATPIPVGAVAIRVPKSVWKDWDGNWTGTNNVSANLPMYPDTGVGMYFSYKEDGDDYLLINNVPLSGGAGLDFTISYTAYADNVPGGATDSNGNYVDGYPYYSAIIPVEIGIDSDGDGIADREDKKNLSLEMHTMVGASSELRVDEIYYSWDPYWGAEPEDSEDYFYIRWYGISAPYHSQPYNLEYTEGTIHDGTVVKYYKNGRIVLKYPKTLLENIPVSGLQITNQMIFRTIWKSGYITEQARSATVTIYPESLTTGTFLKQKYYNASSKMNGAQEDLVNDKKNVDLCWELSYDGADRSSEVTWDDDTKTYNATSRTIEFTDGRPGDLLYSSGKAKSKYVWEPETGNVILNDNDYYISGLRLKLTEYDSEQLNGSWREATEHTSVADYEGIDIYLRYSNSEDYVFYKTVYAPSIYTFYVSLPDKVVGYKVQHATKFYKTKFDCYGIFSLNPTARLTDLIGSDLSEGVSSIVKDKGRCRIWDTGDPENVFYEATNEGEEDESASNVTYELEKSTTYQYTAKYAATEDQILFDASARSQDSPMYIAGWNYNNSSNRLSPMESGVFYDLLPKGTTVDEESIFGIPMTGSNKNYVENRAGEYQSWKNSSFRLDEALYSVRFESNWENSGRTMMIISWSTPEGKKYTGMQFWYLLHNTYDNVVDSGTSIENDVAHVDMSKKTALPDKCSGNLGTITESDYYKDLRGIIRMCEQVAASGNALIPYSA